MRSSRKRRRPATVPKIPKAQRLDVTRAEFNRAIDILNERGQIISDVRRDLDVQFKRIAQLQAEVDALVRQLGRLKNTI